ncbi:MAG: hypothetical protein IPJ75_12645 [Ignavibacteriales bacterium]|nr:hypothetical protein [Ignavibacteriales bacterium]
MTKSIVSFVFLLLLLATTPLVAQRAGDVVPGEIIIQMRPAAETSDILSEFSSAGLKSERLLSKRMNIWLISYDTKRQTVTICFCPQKPSTREYCPVQSCYGSQG